MCLKLDLSASSIKGPPWLSSPRSLSLLQGTSGLGTAAPGIRWFLFSCPWPELASPGLSLQSRTENRERDKQYPPGSEPRTGRAGSEQDCFPWLYRAISPNRAAQAAVLPSSHPSSYFIISSSLTSSPIPDFLTPKREIAVSGRTE